MDVREILAELELYTGTFPKEALESAIANRDGMIPELLAVLEKSAGNLPNLVDRPEYVLHVNAMFLLAQFREPRAYPLIVQFFSGPGEIVHNVTGDVITEYLGRILASVSCGDDSLIKSLIENEEVDEYVRGAALRALIIMVARDEKPRDEVISYFHELFTGRIEREYSHVWNALVSCSTDLYPEELFHHIEQCYRDDLVASLYVDLGDAEDVLALGKERALSELRDHRSHTLITDTISDMEWWACFQPEGAPDPEPTKDYLSRLFPRPPRPVRPRYQEPMRSNKIGRNEPCPCGSGKKYKKCCLRKDEADRVAAHPGVAGGTDALDDLSNSVLDLVRCGKLEEAEEVCRQLLTEYPDQVDGLDRLAGVYEAKGEKLQAAEYHRKAADFMRTHPGFDEVSIAWTLSQAERLEEEYETGPEAGGPRCRD